MHRCYHLCAFFVFFCAWRAVFRIECRWVTPHNREGGGVKRNTRYEIQDDREIPKLPFGWRFISAVLPRFFFGFVFDMIDMVNMINIGHFFFFFAATRDSLLYCVEIHRFDVHTKGPKV